LVGESMNDLNDPRLRRFSRKKAKRITQSAQAGATQ